MKYLHTMIRVGNLERSIAFYTQVLGFREVRRSDYPEDKFTLAFLQAPDERDKDSGPMLELTYNYGVDHYDLGNGYGHIALQVDSIDALGVRLEAAQWSFSWGPGTSPNGKKKMAFVKDPDGYQIELLEFTE